jgi:hypothetical protein
MIKKMKFRKYLLKIKNNKIDFIFFFSLMLLGSFLFSKGASAATDYISPTPIGGITDPTSFPYPYGFGFRDNFAYVLNDSWVTGSVDLTTVDISNPSSPAIVNTFKDTTNLNGNAAAIAISGNYAFISNSTDRIVTVDISNPHSPSTVGSVIDSSNLAGINTMKIVGNYLYVGMCSGSSASGIAVVDISNPLSPRVRGHIASPDLSCSYIIDVKGQYLYAPQDVNEGSFTIVDISDPDNPAITGTLDDATNLSWAAGVDVIGEVAYVYASDVAETGSRFNAIDVSNPASPKLISSLHVSTFAEDNNIAVAYPYLYAEGGGSSPGIIVVNISDPTNMSVVQTVNAPTAVGYPLAIYSTYLFSGNGRDAGNMGFSVFDISGATSQPDSSTATNANSPQKARIDSWTASPYTDQTTCPQKIKLTIKGHHFQNNTEVRIGNTLASSTNKKSSQEMTANFCLQKLLDIETNHQRSVSVKNPDTGLDKDNKKMDLDSFLPKTSTPSKNNNSSNASPAISNSASIPNGSVSQNTSNSSNSNPDNSPPTSPPGRQAGQAGGQQTQPQVQPQPQATNPSPSAKVFIWWNPFTWF